MTSPAHHLAVHGAIVLLFALLLGAPYARAIKAQADPQVIHSWRVAHQSLSLGAGLMFALAGVLHALVPLAWAAWLVAASFIVSSYAFCVATPLAALTGDRGLARGGQGWGRVVYGANWVVAGSSLVGAGVLAVSAIASLMG